MTFYDRRREEGEERQGKAERHREEALIFWDSEGLSGRGGWGCLAASEPQRVFNDIFIEEKEETHLLE